MSTPLRPSDPARLGPYRLLGRLGRGGQGVVYLGEDADRVRAAVKTLHAHADDDERQRARLAGEVAAARLVEPFCTAQVLAADVDADPPWIASEYVEGPSLQEAVATAGPRRGAALTRIAVATATALAAIHDAGVVHRDFKPGNVLLGPDGARVIDFGIARATDATATGGVVGTPAYMAPEQFAGRGVGPAADVFAWACVLGYAATGRPPFGADDIMAVIGRISRDEPDLGDLAEPLRSLAAACLDRDPAVRPTARDVLLRLVTRSTTTPDVGTAAALAAGERAAGERAAEVPADRPAEDAADRPAPGETWVDGGVLGSGTGAAGGVIETVDAPFVRSPDRSPDGSPDGPPGASPSPAARTRPPRRGLAVGLAVLITLVVAVPLAVVGVRTFSAAPAPTGSPTGTPARTPSRSTATEPSVDPTTVPAAFAGTWKGRATELAGNRGSGIDRIELAAGKRTGTMRSVGCDGRLTVQRATATTLTGLVRFPCLYYAHQRVLLVVADGGLDETVWYRADDDVPSTKGHLTRS